MNSGGVELWRTKKNKRDNLGTLGEKEEEMVMMMQARKIDIGLSQQQLGELWLAWIVVVVGGVGGGGGVR